MSSLATCCSHMVPVLRDSHPPSPLAKQSDKPTAELFNNLLGKPLDTHLGRCLR